jgi:hypothetical protein
VDDELKQKGPTSDMIFKVPFLISYISSIMTLMEGDVILTGNDIMIVFAYWRMCVCVCVSVWITNEILCRYA